MIDDDTDEIPIDPVAANEPCPECDGTGDGTGDGKKPGTLCAECEGTGTKIVF